MKKTFLMVIKNGMLMQFLIFYSPFTSPSRILVRGGFLCFFAGPKSYKKTSGFSWYPGLVTVERDFAEDGAA